MLYKAVLTLHFLAMIALVGGAAAVSLVLALAAQGDARDGLAYETVVRRINRWLFVPGLLVAPAAGLWLWGRHNWVLPGWLQYKLGFTLLGILAGAMYVHLFRSELGPLLRERGEWGPATAEATASCRRIVGAAGLLLLAAAVIGTLKPGWLVGS